MRTRRQHRALLSVVRLAWAAHGHHKTASRGIQRQEVFPEQLAQLIFLRQPHHSVGLNRVERPFNRSVEMEARLPPDSTSSTTMSLMMKTDSAISGRGMKNMSPFAGFHDTYGRAASRVRGRSRVQYVAENKGSGNTR